MKGKRIAVLGGAGGIGRALVARLVAEGAQVWVMDMPASLEAHPPAAGVPAIPVDLAEDAQIAPAFQQLAGMTEALDGFVNLAGYAPPREPIAEVSTEVFDAVQAANIRGAVLAAQQALPLLKRGEGASMVHAATGLAAWIRPGYGAYAIAKAGLIALTKTLALESAPRVRVNAVCPGAVETAFLRGGTGRTDESAPVHIDLAPYIAAIPMARLAQPADVVGPICFLLSSESSYMTGQCLWINGGAYMP